MTTLDERIREARMYGARSIAIDIDEVEAIRRAAFEEAAKVALSVFPRGSAHTYASENADVYIAQEAACERIAAAIRALAAPVEPST